MKCQRPYPSVRKLLLFSSFLLGVSITGLACMPSADTEAPNDTNSGEIEQDRGLRITLVVGNEKNRKYPHAKVVIKNETKEVIRIRYDPNPLRYLNLVVWGTGHKRVSSVHYGAMYTSRGEKGELCLRPTEKYEDTVGLFATVKKQDMKAGLYSIQAIYNYNGREYKSNTVSVKLP